MPNLDFNAAAIDGTLQTWVKNLDTRDFEKVPPTAFLERISGYALGYRVIDFGDEGIAVSDELGSRIYYNGDARDVEDALQEFYLITSE